MQEHRSTVGAILALSGGIGVLTSHFIAQVQWVVTTFGSVGTVCTGFIAFMGALALGYKLMKDISTIKEASVFTKQELMDHENKGNLRGRLEASMTRGEGNEKKLDQLLGHSKANKAFATELYKEEQATKAVANQVNEKLDRVLPPQ